MEDKKYNILVIGKGGREHALAWKIKQSPLCGDLFVAKGNAGTTLIAQNVDIDPTDFASLKQFCIEKCIQIVMVGTEEALVSGIWCEFKDDPLTSDIHVIGPSARGALLEGSKSFAKRFMEQFDIPTAKYGKFSLDELQQAKDFLRSMSPPYVLKADGLAAGKGVIISQNLIEAEQELECLLAGRFGKSSEVVVIEEFLDGQEFSVFIATDGLDWKLLPVAKDYKKVGLGDTGPNTGGMGAISPPPFVDGHIMSKVKSRIIEPTLRGIKSLSLKYQGFIFFGLISVNGEPYVIEYNCRLGDPETEAIIPRIESDFVELMLAISNQGLSQIDISISENHSAAIVLTSGGYPGEFKTGFPVRNLEEGLLFHAGTKIEKGDIVTDGGRVMVVVALGDTLKDAVSVAMYLANQIEFEGKYYRHDIGSSIKPD